MLSWLTGSGPADEDESNRIVEQETPGPVFAFRAFKHALVGTPRPVPQPSFSPDRLRRTQSHHTQARGPAGTRDSSDDRTEYNTNRNRQLRGEASARLEQSAPQGILVTPKPGAAARRKSVTFGAHVPIEDGADSGGAGSGEAGTKVAQSPYTVPGAFPATPAQKLAVPPVPSRSEDGARPSGLDDRAGTEPGRLGRSTAKGSGKGSGSDSESDSTIDISRPKSESGRFWKGHFESYSEKSERELKVILAELKSAQRAIERKDEEIERLTDQIRRERTEAREREEELGRQLDTYRARLEALQDEMMQSVKADTVARGMGEAGYRSKSRDIAGGHVAEDAPRTAFLENHSAMSKNEVAQDSLAESASGWRAKYRSPQKPTAAVPGAKEGRPALREVGAGRQPVAMTFDDIDADLNGWKTSTSSARNRDQFGFGDDRPTRQAGAGRHEGGPTLRAAPRAEAENEDMLRRGPAEKAGGADRVEEAGRSFGDAHSRLARQGSGAAGRSDTFWPGVGGGPRDAEPVATAPVAATTHGSDTDWPTASGRTVSKPVYPNPRSTSGAVRPGGVRSRAAQARAELEMLRNARQQKSAMGA